MLCRAHVSVMSHSGTPWTVAYQAPLSMGFSRHEYWSGLSCPPPGDLPDPGIKPASHMSPALVGGFFTTAVPGKPILPPAHYISDLDVSPRTRIQTPREKGVSEVVLTEMFPSA